MSTSSGDERSRWWSSTAPPRTVTAAVRDAALVFAALLAGGLLLHREVRSGHLAFSAAFAGVRLALQLRRLFRDRDRA